MTTWVYVSSLSVKTSGDLTDLFPVGLKIKIVQGSNKYFICESATYAGGETTLVLWGGGTYTVANAAIDSLSYWPDVTSFGFPASMMGSSPSVPGLMPATGTPSGLFLRDDNTWASPAGPMAFDGFINQEGSDYVARMADGEIVASSATDIGTVFNTLRTQIDSEIGTTKIRKIGLRASYAPVLTTMAITDRLTVDGLLATRLYSDSLTLTMMEAAAPGSGTDNNWFINICNLQLLKTNTGTGHTGEFIKVYSPQHCVIDNIETYSLCTTYNAGNTGLAVYLEGSGYTTDWNNVIRDSRLTRIVLDNVGDNNIQNCIIDNREACANAIYLDAAPDTNLINNHMLCWENAGIQINGSSTDQQILGNYFESGGGDGAGHGIYIPAGSALADSIIIGNSFYGLVKSGIYCAGNFIRNVVNGNIFRDNNAGDVATYDDIRIAAEAQYNSQFNTFNGNVFRQGQNRTNHACPIREVDGTYDPDFNVYVANTVIGHYITGGITKVGGSSIKEHNVEYTN